MDTPPRPAPRRNLAEAARDRTGAWLAWFGVGRLLAIAAAVVAVGIGGFWLLRAPRPPAEASLPYASAVPTSTATSPAPPTAPATTSAVAVEPPAAGSVVVHVAGAVAAPGVYEVPAGARVDAAIAAAGGAAADADLNALNLAAVAVDASRIYVPRIGEDPPPPPATVVATTTVVAAPSGPVDLNRAGADELDALPGIGPATARAIVEHRTRNGPFATVDDLEQVPGIGPAKLAAVRDLVTV